MLEISGRLIVSIDYDGIYGRFIEKVTLNDKFS